MNSRRGLVFSLQEPLPTGLLSLLSDFRLLVNQCLREALATGATARGSLSRFASAQAHEARLNVDFGLQAAKIALSLAKSHRRRVRRGIASKVPYVRTAFARAPSRCFHFNIDSGKMRLSLRYGEWTSFHVVPSLFHHECIE
ncbi:MAG: hypothetical protein WAN87_03560, partial [Thermoplasmata archaeon]